jgi:hypothetical protein
MNLTINTIYTFKLASGEELVARIMAINPDHLVIAHPILTALSPQGLQMMPGLFSADLSQNVRLNNSNWVMIAEAREDIKNSWIEATTGIRPATRQIITG